MLSKMVFQLAASTITSQEFSDRHSTPDLEKLVVSSSSLTSSRTAGNKPVSSKPSILADTAADW
jgi:hypothetical protein